MSLFTKPSSGNIQEETKTQNSNELNGEDIKPKNFTQMDEVTERKPIRPLSLFQKNLSGSREEVREANRVKDVNQKTEKLINPFTLLKEDFSAIFNVSLSKERPDDDVTMKPSLFSTSEDPSKRNRSGNILKIIPSKNSQKNARTETHNDIEVNTEDSTKEDLPPRSQGSEKTVRSLNLFKWDLSLSKEVDKDRDVSQKTNQSREPINPLTLLKEDFHNFKEDISVIFRKNPPKEGGDKDVTIKSSSSSVLEGKPSKAKPSKVDRGGDILRIFQKGKLSNRNEEQAKTNFLTSTRQKKERNNHEGSREKKEKQEASGSLPLQTSLTGLPFLNRTENLSTNQLTEDLWSLKNFASYLTLDPNTANSEIYLSDSNRKARRLWLDHQTQEHPDRFEYCPQVLCREGLLDLVYWEVVWCGGADIGVTYNSISRDGDTESCLLGHNEHSWSLECSEGSYTPCHNRKRFKSSSPKPFTHRVGVFLNWPAGSLSFYCVSQEAMVHLHTFSSTFTEPLYPGFWVWAYNGSVTLCQVEMDWERLLKS